MKKVLFAIVMAVSVVAVMAAEYKLELKVNKPDGVFKVGEKAVFTCRVLKDGKPVEGVDVRYYIAADNQRTKRGKFISGGTWKKEATLAYPGWVHLGFSIHDDKGKMMDITTVNWNKKTKVKAVGIGALFAPEKLVSVYPEPKDFDEFWAQVRKELDAVPVKELKKKEVKLSKSHAKKIVCYDVQVACAGATPVSGYLIMPRNAKPKSCPVVLYYDGAGVRDSSKNLSPALKGAIYFGINAHGIENGKPKAFYENLKKTKLNHYSHSGKNNRDTFYFKGMYMRVMRSLDYIKTLPEWDGKHIIVTGGSQGGGQVFAACALDKDVTYAVAGVPAMSDHAGCLARRESGWPRLYKATKDGKPEDPQVAAAVAYYDNVYFAKRVKCPINVNTGLFDRTCVPTSVMAVFNNIPETTQKWLTIVPDGAHGAHHNPGNKRRDAYIDMAIKSNQAK
ncbi:MAG: acetylxylan esterase [Lentisphaeria bacterium]|nr:acetylxylan esterase [Lentisphaeria bacterium]